jgi:predicted metal-dependent HD superfamily phosphohydrolase
MKNFIEFARGLFHPVGMECVRPVWEFIDSSYQQPWRFYHNIEHIKRSLDEFEDIEKLLKFPDTVELTIWLHDIIYIPGSKLNERMSGDTAFLICKRFQYQGASAKPRQRLLEPPIGDIGEAVRKLIVGHPDPVYRNDWKYFRDTDYSIMAEEPVVYDEYVKGVYSEFLPIYSKEDIQHYREGFLTKLKKKVFLTEYFRDLYESNALLNIDRELSNHSGEL